QLLERLASSGAQLLLESIDALDAGTATFTAQDHSAATDAPKLSTSEARIDWTLPAEQVSAHIRGMSPDPGAWTLLDGRRMKVLGVEEPPTEASELALPPGRLAHLTSRPGDRGSGRQAGHARTGLGPGSRPRSRGRLRR